MNNIVFSILLSCVGLIIGFVIAIVINSLRGNQAQKKADALINKANKEIEKAKRDAAIAQKEEAILRDETESGSALIADIPEVA